MVRWRPQRPGARVGASREAHGPDNGRARSRRELGLGAAGLVPLAEARELALANRMLARSGGDPLAREAPRRGRSHLLPRLLSASRRVC